MKKISIIVIIILIIILIVGFFIYRGWLISFLSGAEVADIGNVKIEDFVFADETTDKYEIKVMLPLFTNYSDRIVIDQVNKLLADKFQENIDNFKADSDQNFIAEVGAPSLLQVGYEIVLLTNNVASLRFNTFYYVAGMAHPITNYESFNYDLKDNKQIALADVFNTGSDYLTVLSSLSRQALKDQIDSSYYSEDFVNPGTEPTVENFSVFNFTKDKIVVTFDQCRVGPCVAGEQFVDVPFGNLTDILKQDGIIK